LQRSAPLHFSTREIALFLWVIVFASWALSKPNVRQSVWRALRIAANVKLITPYLLMLGNIALLISVLAGIGLWHVGLLKDTILWTLGAGTILYFGASEAAEDGEKYFRKVLLRLLTWTILVEFIANLVTFPLWVELITVPFLFFLFGVNAVSGLEEKNRPAKKLTDIAIATYGFTVLGISLFILSQNPSGHFTFDGMLAFALGFLLTFGLLPYVYGLAIWALYETLFVRMRYFTENESVFRYARRRLVLKFGLSLRELNEFSHSAGILGFNSRAQVDEHIVK